MNESCPVARCGPCCSVAAVGRTTTASGNRAPSSRRVNSFQFIAGTVVFLPDTAHADSHGVHDTRGGGGWGVKRATLLRHPVAPGPFDFAALRPGEPAGQRL